MVCTSALEKCVLSKEIILLANSILHHDPFHFVYPFHFVSLVANNMFFSLGAPLYQQ